MFSLLRNEIFISIVKVCFVFRFFFNKLIVFYSKKCIIGENDLPYCFSPVVIGDEANSAKETKRH